MIICITLIRSLNLVWVPYVSCSLLCPFSWDTVCTDLIRRTSIDFWQYAGRMAATREGLEPNLCPNFDLIFGNEDDIASHEDPKQLEVDQELQPKIDRAQ